MTVAAFMIFGTAACLWLARGVDPATVRAWMGHESIATANRYLHHLATGAEMAGLARLNEALVVFGLSAHVELLFVTGHRSLGLDLSVLMSVIL